MLQYRTALAAGVAFAGIGMVWLVLSILSYGAPPQPTLVPVEQNDNSSGVADLPPENDKPSLEFSTLNPTDVAGETKGAVSNSDYGVKVEFVRSTSGYLAGGIGPVNSEGEGPPPEPNALLLSATKFNVWHHKMILCGPDSICIEDSGGGIIMYASLEEEKHDPGLYQFYPLNEVNWGLGDTVHVWMLVSHASTDGNLIGEPRWVDVGDIIIEKCTSETLCPDE
jgi:hypothetical protein